MTGAPVLSNLLTWALQVAMIVIVATLTPPIVRLVEPKARLAYWQLVLLACLILPFVHAWKQETVIFNAVAGAPVSLAATDVMPAPATLPVTFWLLLAIAVGCLARLGWLLAGFRSMRQFRRNSIPLDPPSSWGAEADLRISDDVRSPVTFGFRHPVILLPRSFPYLEEPTREAILCHEVLHVRRHDWLLTVAEELLRAALWFHPAIWWVLGEIQLAREQAVDREAIGMTKSRNQYVDALLAIAGAGARTDLSPAPLFPAQMFLRKRHLKQRVVSILKEVHMSKTRSVSALAASLVLLAGSCWFVTGAFPLYGAPQVVSDAAGVAVEMNGAQLMHRNSVAYPPDAAAQRVEGLVTVQVKLDGRGNVSDASILSGPEQLRKAVLQSVLNWHFAKTEANSTRQVSVSFAMPKNGVGLASGVPGGITGGIAGGSAPPPLPTPMIRTGDFSSIAPPPPAMVPAVPRTFKSLDFAGSQQARAELMALLPLHEGDQITPDLMSRTLQAIREYDEHLRPSFRQISPTEMQLVVAPMPDASAAMAGPSPIRVGGNVAQANLLSQIKPLYPPIAKEARVQGTVQFEATIGLDGHVESLHLLSGAPLLIQAALQAVQQWVYRPTLLNGNPVRVITTIEVNFTLAE